ncbi:4Fe-4S dicluster domain-containing protein [Pseudodesulfovibrio sp. zrk46]|uniref:ATP-binding protein n=1 Tax=Pseudodesulfovibrio sp. zrk46 TaxID=2725288 RepID=UPI00144A2866|nr:4Fe-4S dicluster domain-containing protein [Pseudodesulfovibrio sp. zrk46]QJB57122.1 4Fe-4S dicluster domain-containing protein [Pseudodesulfovibrio sp. zrk46]
MGHIIGKDVYRQLGNTLDNTPVRMPWSKAMRDMLEALYTPGEAELITRMPYRPSTIQRVARVTGINEPRLHKMLPEMCHKGLICDIHDGEQYQYMIAPFVIGFFEFSMMRTRGELQPAKWAELFQAYMFGDNAFMEANFGDGQQVSVMRALPYEETVRDVDHVEILDYEKASALIEDQDLFAVSLCACRHEKHHLGTQGCDVPLETCTSMGSSAEFLIRNEFARQVDKSEFLDIFARSKDMGFTLSTDNVKQGAGFVCHCCGCCCNLMHGIKHSGYPGILVTSSFIAKCDEDSCNGCGKCVRACPIDAVTMQERPTSPGEKKRKYAVVDQDLCLGCGVCALKCKPKSMELHKRDQKVFHPEDSFERVIIQSLERDTLQNLIFDNPNSQVEGFMRGIVGGFLKISPVKKALMGEKLRSRFLNAIRNASG